MKATILLWGVRMAGLGETLESRMPSALLIAVVEGAPAGFDIDVSRINEDLARRQKGYGRGGRMAIERDEVRTVSGIRFGRTIGSPVTARASSLSR